MVSIHIIAFPAVSGWVSTKLATGASKQILGLTWSFCCSWKTVSAPFQLVLIVSFSPTALYYFLTPPPSLLLCCPSVNLQVMSFYIWQKRRSFRPWAARWRANFGGWAPEERAAHRWQSDASKKQAAIVFGTLWNMSSQAFISPGHDVDSLLLVIRKWKAPLDFVLISFQKAPVIIESACSLYAYDFHGHEWQASFLISFGHGPDQCMQLRLTHALSCW